MSVSVSVSESVCMCMCVCVCVRACVFDVHEDASKQEDEDDIGARRSALKQEDDDAFKLTMLSN